MSHFYKEADSESIFIPFLDKPSEHPSGLRELKPNTTDGAEEKHVPSVLVDGNRVTVEVGSVPHPMLEEHYITAIYLETKLGGQLHRLNPGEKPQAEFLLAEGDEPVAAYEYCNIHGLWKKTKIGG